VNILPVVCFSSNTVYFPTTFNLLAENFHTLFNSKEVTFLYLYMPT
jgi:hypothetical protein